MFIPITCLLNVLLATTPTEAGDGPVLVAEMEQAWTFVDAIQRHSIDPPDRKRLFEVGVRSVCHFAKAEVPDDWSDQLDAVSRPGDLAAFLMRFRKPSYGPREMGEHFRTALFSAVPGGGSFLPAAELKVADQLANNRYIGIGIASSFNAKENRVEVGSVFRDGPAHRAGLQAGDMFDRIDERDTAGMPLKDALALLRGAEGTDVTVTVRRPSGESRTLKITRALIPRPSVVGRLADDKLRFLLPSKTEKIGYAHLREISGSTLSELRKLDGHLRDQRAAALILDLRFMNGGVPEQTTLVADALLDGRLLDGGVMWRVRKRNGHVVVVDADDDCLFRGLPLAVIVNESTSTAGLLLAAALQDAHRATIVGDKAECDGYARAAFELPGGLGCISLVAGYLERSWHATEADLNGPKWTLRPDHLVALDKQQRENLLLEFRDFDIVSLPACLGDPPNAADEPQLSKAIEVIHATLHKTTKPSGTS